MRLSLALLALAIVAGPANSIALTGAHFPSSYTDRSVELVRRTPLVARCAGRREEMDCRVRRYCHWYRGYRRPDGSKVEAHCQMRDWYRTARERAKWKD
jgi:hypothetical protein